MISGRICPILPRPRSISESEFYILTPEEVEAMYGSGLSIDGSRWMEYMDRETMDRILKEREICQE